MAGFNVKGWCLRPRQHLPRPISQKVVDLLDQLVDLGDLRSVLFPRNSSCRVFARAIGEVVYLHPPVLRVAVAISIFLRGPMRGVPRYEEAVFFLPNVLPDVGVGFPKGCAARLEDGWATVGRDLNLACGVAKEEGKGQGLALHHARPWGQHLGDAPHFGYLAVREGTRDCSGDNDSRARVTGSARGVGAKDIWSGVDKGARAPYP